jgi:hypothetical protein
LRRLLRADRRTDLREEALRLAQRRHVGMDFQLLP